MVRLNPPSWYEATFFISNSGTVPLPNAQSATFFDNTTFVLSDAGGLYDGTAGEYGYMNLAGGVDPAGLCY